MKLTEVFAGVATQTALTESQVSGLTADTRQLEKGGLFFCLTGSVADGHRFAPQALEQGALAVVCERDLGLDRQILVADTHAALSLCCANWFGNPQRALKLVGVTGTNGKTTVTHLIRDILEGLGRRTGLIGTIETDVAGIHYPAKYTTPDPMTFYSLLAQMRDAGCEYAIMEVSSHGLDQKRVEGCTFEVGAFTNLTQDHLDYHGDMERYYLAKRRLFEQSKLAVVNLDDEWGRRLAGEVSCPVKSFSMGLDEADFTAKNLLMQSTGSSFAFVGNGVIARVKLPLPGAFSVSNAMAALGACLALGFGLEECAGQLSHAHGVPGRFEVLKTDTPYAVIRDYAHSPDAVQKVLEALRAVTKGKITILFGCAGNRDRKKRRLMTEAAAKLADFIVLTSDNPRREDPLQIIEDAMPGLEGTKTPYIIIPDRYEAISWALDHAKPGETLLLAGKGHEDYQVLAHGTIHFDEREVVAELLAAKAKTEE